MKRNKFLKFLCFFAVLSVILSMLTVFSFADVSNPYTLEGCYYFNETISLFPSNPYSFGSFYAYNKDFAPVNWNNMLKLNEGNGLYSLIYVLESENIYDYVEVYSYGSDKWIDQRYRHIYIPEAVSVPSVLYEWFISNAQRSSDDYLITSGSYTFKSNISLDGFVPITTDFSIPYEYFPDFEGLSVVSGNLCFDAIGNHYLAFNSTTQQWYDDSYRYLTISDNINNYFFYTWFYDNIISIPMGNYIVDFEIWLLNYCDKSVPLDFTSNGCSYTSLNISSTTSDGIVYVVLKYDDTVVCTESFQDGILLSREWSDEDYKMISLADAQYPTEDVYEFFESIFFSVVDVELYELAYRRGFEAGFKDGLDVGYNSGLNEGVGQSFMGNFIGNIIEGLDAFTIIGGFSLWNLIQTIVSFSIVLFILKLISGG